MPDEIQPEKEYNILTFSAESQRQCEVREFKVDEWGFRGHTETIFKALLQDMYGAID